MTVLVTDTGFGPDDWAAPFAGLADWQEGQALDLPPDTPPELLAALPAAPLIRVDFPSFADGRGFTLARLLRLQGYKGRLRAHGHVLADQFTMARRAGFDEVEISAELAARQPENQWLARSDWRAHDYQSRMRAG